MNEIKLLVEDKNLETVLTILQNLKSGLIAELQCDAKSLAPKRTTQYQPKVNTIIKEENSGTSDKSGKYVSVSAYRQRLKKK